MVKGRFIDATPLDLPVAIILVAVLVSSLRVEDLTHSLPKIAGILFAVALYYALVSFWGSPRFLRVAVVLFLVGGVGFSILGLMGMPTFKEKHLDLLMKIKDKLPHIDFGLPGAELGFAPTVVGGILLLVFPLFVMTIIYTWKRKRKGLVALVLSGLGIISFVLLLTQARGAWAGLFISSVLGGLLFLMTVVKRKKIYGMIVSMLLIGSIIAGMAVYFTSRAEELRPGLKQAEGTLLFRVQLWDLAIPKIRENPMWGLGLNNFRLVPEVRYFLSHPHNQFLDVAIELGIPAMLAFMGLLIILGYMCIEVMKKSTDPWWRYTIVGLGWGQLAHALFGITDAIPPGAKVGILFWISGALITSIYLFTVKGND